MFVVTGETKNVRAVAEMRMEGKTNRWKDSARRDMKT